MSHFYLSAKGARKPKTLTGTKNSGISAHIRGWDTGVNVQIRHADGFDCVYVYRSSGSNASKPDSLIKFWKVKSCQSK